jgi:hypothetical protein
MKVLKFVGGDTGPPEIEYLEEIIGLGDGYASYLTQFESFSDTIGLGEFSYAIIEESVLENLALGDNFYILTLGYITEFFGLGDVKYQPDYINIFESLGLSDDESNAMDIFVEIDESLGLGDSGGFGYLQINYNLRWRTRTKKLNYGYGTAPYGDTVSYGDGDVIDELKEFKVKVIRLSDDTLLRTATIIIANKQFPDGSAQYIYTSAMNISDNTIFEPNLRFEVYQVDVNDNWSPAKYIDITVTDGGGDLI